MSTQQRIAVVTGAGSGVGAATATHLIASGWRVFGLDRSFGAAESSDGAMRIHCDVSSSVSVAEAFARIAAEAPRIDALICSAGVIRTGTLESISETDFDTVFAVNVRGGWLSAKAALPLLGNAEGRSLAPRIVFMSSIAAIRPKLAGGVYAASKAALSTLARVLAVEVAQRGILVNAVAPGTVDTPFVKGASTTGDVVGLIDFLLGPASSYISGAVIPLDGGTTAAFVPPKG